MTNPPEFNGPVSARWSDPFKTPSVWVPPFILVAILVLAMTVFYFGSVVNPTAHMHGLPVTVVNQDAGARVGSQRVDFGAQVTQRLTHSTALTGRLDLRPATLAHARSEMDRGRVFATVVIPPGFTASLLAVAGVRSASDRSSSRPTVELLTNPRAGTLGVGLATGVLQPALAIVSRRLGDQLQQLSGTGSGTAVSQLLDDPLTVQAIPFRPLPSHTALGLSAFYISLLATFCGFLGAVIVNMSVDGVLGYATIEVGPFWRQRQPVRISRWQTLLTKWLMALGLTVVLTGLMLGVATVLLNMNAPNFASLWLLCWFAATVVAIGTLVLFAALGTAGQIAAMLVFIYLALASSGGTVPLQALPSFFRFLAEFEPLRQILAGTRAILYFNARGDAGLTRAWVASGAGLVFWLVLGAGITNWYDRKSLHRMQPETLAYVDRVISEYRATRAAPTD
jgi:YhgE/Pip-like protein